MGWTRKWLYTPPYPTQPLTHRSSISAISQLLLTRFWWNFKGSFLGLFRKDLNYLVNFCPGKICPGDICPYKEYLRCYWPDFDETLNVPSWEHPEQISTIKMTFFQATFDLGTFVHIRDVSAFTNSIFTKL